MISGLASGLWRAARCWHLSACTGNHAGTSAQEVRQAYSRWAATYDRDANRTRDLDQQVTRQLLLERHFTRVLELGCGTGKNTATLADIGAQVVAMDFSPGMLLQARANIDAAHVAFVEADLTLEWPSQAQAMDLVVGNLVLEHIDDLTPVFAQAAQRLVTGGMLLVCELHPFRQYQGTQARFTDTSGAPVLIPAFQHHVSDYLRAAGAASLVLRQLDEWWHVEDKGLPPRLLSLVFDKP